MNFSLEQTIELLNRTPKALAGWLSGLSEAWLTCDEGEGTWNARQVIEHLIEAERTNWIPRLESMLANEDEPLPLPPFDRFAHLRQPGERPMDELLLAFATVRARNVDRLQALLVTGDRLERRGLHPAFGEVSVRELLSTWAVHDLTHTAQIARVLANRYRTDVGPWQEYLGILKQR
ncbi:DinB family protein [Paenibacillus sp. TRM 82003]|nr:DinB family protein [Paenibacillus sp. TRM 82003]